MTQTPSTPAGWYPDPENAGAQRYWDGTLWAAPTVPPPPPALPPVKKKRSKAGIALLVIGVVILATIGISVAVDSGKKAPAALTGGSKPAATTPAAEESSSSSTTPPPAAYVPKPADFKITIKTRKKDCFGSAGCIVTYRIVPAYSGEPFDGSYDVTYRVTGDEDGPIVNTFTIDEDGQASFDAEETASTPSAHTVLKGKVTEVSPS